MTPYLQRPLELGCDIVLHSATKFINGHSDVICGLVIAKDEELGGRIRYIQNAFGAIAGPQDSFLTLRGLRTLKVRMDQSQAAAMEIANWLTKQPCVTKVHFPGLADHPGHETHCAPVRRTGRRAPPSNWILWIPPDASWSNPDCRRSPSAWEELKVSSPIRRKCPTRPCPPEERIRKGITDTLVRLSVGLEDPIDLIEEMTDLFHGKLV